MHLALTIGALLLPLTGLAGASCPETLPEFIAQFEKSDSFQRKNTRFPLPYSYIDGHAAPEPKTITVMVNRSTARKFPSIKYPTQATQRTVPLERKSWSTSEGIEVIRFDKPDTDMHTIEFHFKRSASCWQLMKVDDLSL